MSTEIKKQDKNTVQVIDFTAKATEYLTAMGLQLPEKHKKMFLELSQAYGLNPFKREIYAVGYGENFNIITGYEVYIRRAENSGKLDGWSVDVKGKASDWSLSATITIYRKDWSHPFEHTVYYHECVSKNRDGNPTAIWNKMPVFMTKKVAIAQGFRLCFSEDLGGMPYTADEINVEDTTVEVLTSKPIQQPAVQHPTPPTEPTENEKRKVFNYIQSNDFENATKEVNILKAKYPSADFAKMSSVLQAAKDKYAQEQAQATQDEPPF